MKVEQLKAELVVFKGLMSNVSAAATPLALLPRGSSSQQAACNQAEQAFLVAACDFLSAAPSRTLLRFCFFPLPPLNSREKEGTRVPVLCWTGSLEVLQQSDKNTDPGSETC